MAGPQIANDEGPLPESRTTPQMLALKSYRRGFSIRLASPDPKTATTFEQTTNIRAISGQPVRDKMEAISKCRDGHFDILSLLIKSNNFSGGELVNQLLTFLAAGYFSPPLLAHMLNKAPTISRNR